jgi:2-iminobutanoate/2-iminopropanoate deaminase
LARFLWFLGPKKIRLTGFLVKNKLLLKLIKRGVMNKRIITTDQAAAAVGPYSQAVVAGPFVFISGQIPLNQQGQMVQGDIVVQTVQVIENLKAVLGAAGLSLADVVKTTVFLADMADFAEMNRVYAEFFPEEPPARSTFQVAALPRNASVEIEAVALRKE